jgi:hypothetical protein
LRPPSSSGQLVAARFTLHLPTPSAVDASAITDPVAVERWVIGHRAKFARLTFRFEAGPFVDVAAGVVAGPWAADISTDATPRWACGMDTLAF